MTGGQGAVSRAGPCSGKDEDRPGLAGLLFPVRDLRPCRAGPRRAEHAGMDDDAGGTDGGGEFARLGRAESLRLLATVPVGRLIFTIGALPAVRLMNFVLTDGLILMRTRRG